MAWCTSSHSDQAATIVGRFVGKGLVGRFRGQADVEAAFSRIVPFPEAGPNSHRAEVLLSAFADAVVTLGADGVRRAIAADWPFPKESTWLMPIALPLAANIPL